MPEEIFCKKLQTTMSDSICKEKKDADCGDCPNKKSGRSQETNDYEREEITEIAENLQDKTLKIRF